MNEDGIIRKIVGRPQSQVDPIKAAWAIQARLRQLGVNYVAPPPVIPPRIVVGRRRP